MLGCGVHALQRKHPVGDLAAQVHQHAAAGAQGGQRGECTVDHAPEVHVEQAAMIVLGHLVQATVDRDTGIVHPGVDASMRGDDAGDGILHLSAVGHIDTQGLGPAAFGVDGRRDVLEGFAAACQKHHIGPALGGQQRGAQTDPAGRTGDDDDLFVQWRVLHRGAPA